MPCPLSPLNCCSFAPAGRCGRCRPAKGRSQRVRHFCQSDFGERRGWEGAWGRCRGTCPAQGAPYSPHSLPGPDPGTALGGAGDALRGGGENAVPAPLPAGAPGVHVGAQHLRVPPAPGGRRVPAHGAAARQLRAHAQPHPAAGRRLRPAMDTPRGPAGAGGSPALPPAPAALSLSGSIARGGGGWRDPGGWKRSCHVLSPLHGRGGATVLGEPRPALGAMPGISPSLGSTWLRGGWWRRVVIYFFLQKINPYITTLAIHVPFPGWSRPRHPLPSPPRGARAGGPLACPRAEPPQHCTRPAARPCPRHGHPPGSAFRGRGPAAYLSSGGGERVLPCAGAPSPVTQPVGWRAQPWGPSGEGTCPGGCCGDGHPRSTALGTPGCIARSGVLGWSRTHLGVGLETAKG